VTGVAGLVGL